MWKLFAAYDKDDAKFRQQSNARTRLRVLQALYDTQIHWGTKSMRPISICGEIQRLTFETLPFLRRRRDRLVRALDLYSQLSPCGHPAITDNKDSSLIPGKKNYRRFTEINSRFYGLSLIRIRMRGPYSVRYKGSWMYFGGPEFKSRPDRLLDLFLAVPSSNPRLRL